MRLLRKSILKQTSLFLAFLHTTAYALEPSQEEIPSPKRILMMRDVDKKALQKFQAFIDKSLRSSQCEVIILNDKQEKELADFSIQYSNYLGFKLESKTSILKKAKEKMSLHNTLANLLKKIKAEAKPIFDEIITGNTKLLRHMVDATYGREDCQEQTILTLSIVSQKKHFDELPPETQDLLALQYLLTDRNFRDKVGMVAYFDIQEFTKKRQQNEISELKRLLANSTLNHTLMLAKRYCIPSEDPRLRETNELLQLPVLTSIQVLLKYGKEYRFPFVLKHIQLYGDEKERSVSLQDIKLCCFQVDGEKYQYVEKPRDESSIAIGVRLYSVLKKGENFSDLSKKDLETFLLDKAKRADEKTEFSKYVERHELDREYRYTGEEAPLEILHIYPCTFAQQLESIKKTLVSKGEELSGVVEAEEDDRNSILKLFLSNSLRK